jgi:hypothetical protein
MSTIKLALDRLESRLQSLVESSAARLFPGNRTAHELSSSLMEAMRSSVQSEPEEGSQLPNIFIILVHPEQADLLQADQVLIDGLKQSLREAVREIGLDLPVPLALRFEPDPGLARGDVQVIARNSLEDLSQTNDIEVPLDEISDETPVGVFLIVDGTRIFPLEQVVVNIGRRPDNHLVVDDPRVSRLHAQLRLVRGRYVIFDLDSTGGTWVNGQRVNQQTLFPGDVISLSGVPVVFGQDGLALGETQEYVPPS